MRRILTAISLFVFLILLGCADQTAEPVSEMSPDNPFHVELNEPIQYSALTPADIDEYVTVTIDQTNSKLDGIKAEEQLTFDNTFGIMDVIMDDMVICYTNASMMYDVSTDSLTRIKASKGYQRIDSMFTSITSDKELFEKLNAFATSESGKELQGAEERLISQIIKELKRSGVDLSPQDQKTYKKLNSEITALSTAFSTNMSAYDDFIELDEEQADGLPENFKIQYKLEEGGYKIPVNNATSDPVLSNASSSDIRKAYAMKFYNIGADGNLALLDSLLKKRYQLGRLMGYESFAGYNLERRMAKTPKRVWEFLNGLTEASKEKALKDAAGLISIRNTELNLPADNNGGKDPIDPWDISYYQTRLLKAKFNVDNEKIREYLPMESCMQGMFTIYQQLLGFTFKKVEEASVWADDVEMYEVYDGDELRGRFYLDLYPRANKNTWFHAQPLVMGRQTEAGYEIPQGMLLGNFTKPTDQLPSLLSLRELNTLFHEFGHIMNLMSYEGKYFTLAETKADFVESMSQIFENWIEDYDVLSSFAHHYETGEVFPRELFDNIKRAKEAASGLSLYGMLRIALYDINLYDKYDPEHPLNTDQLWKDIETDMGIMPYYMEGTHRQASIIHFNTHPVYVYGYLWSNVYAEDMFTEFEKNGLLDAETGMRYRKLILSNGSQRDVDEVVEEFLGRPTNNEAYIKSLGL
ncbi:M3 family metallopeptidase [Robertkochia solimangrovi]|uniref:M3 family metallopeptidase n=1 Tax=Robertkochia solimangrovi TaxID=2213046 RepID=UPI00118158AC|nr:M3 family metallopeptidase [Robertkochia solimangrovi]TRZ46248.1 hypothetical protein DMZ48_03040 [Robertkochia solimangrovi]